VPRAAPLDAGSPLHSANKIARANFLTRAITWSRRESNP
jgi:hypothetical protein